MNTNYRLLVTTSLTAFLTMSNLAMANPLGGEVVAGSATITEVGKKLDIHQTTDRTVIDWRGFDIAPDEHTQFYQPNSSAIALNRINSTNASTIAGQLTANGNVILINPNGVFFSKTSTVDVNGLIATTADIDNQKFMAGGLSFDKPGNANAGIINAGSITAKEAGLVGLVAPNVENSGIITARLGRVHLASGDTATIDLYGDGLMEVKASDAITSQLVKNTGKIHAEGGMIALTAAAGRATVNSVVKVSGELNAPAVGVRNGKIIIAAEGSNAVAGNVAADKGNKQGASNVIISAAKLDASGKNTGEKGGNITITGDDITLSNNSIMDASGTNGGGNMLIGGEYQGKGATSTARTLLVEQGVLLFADALTNGNGGSVILWADDATRFHGSIVARGGAQGGNGGFVETSGHNTLSVSGSTVDLTDSLGNAGTWLLDPTDITFVSNATASDGVNSFKASDLVALSSSANVILSATNNITFDMGGDSANLASNRDITLAAGNDMLTASASTITTAGTGSINFTADSDMQLNGLQLQATGSGNISLSGVNSLRTDTITLGSGNLTLSTNDNLTIGSQLTGSGNLYLTPYTAATKMRIDDGTNLDFSLNNTEIGLIQSNWNMIHLGRADGNVSFVPLRDTTWSNSLTISNNSENLFANQIHMINGASLSFENGTLQLFNNITTDGGDVNFIGNGELFGRGGSIVTSGGDINLKRFIQVSSIGTYDTRGSGNDGDINVTQGIGETYSTSPTGVKLYAGTGTIAFGGAVDGVFGGGYLDIEASGGTLSFNGAWGLKGANNFPVLRNISLTSLNTDFTLPNLATTGNVSLNAGSGTITTGTIATGAGNLSYISDDVVINGNLTGNGTLSLETASNSKLLRVGFYGGDYNIDTSEIARFQPGWSLIKIGKNTGTNGMNIGATDWSAPVQFLADAINIRGAITNTSGNSVRFTAHGYNLFLDGSSVTTQAGNVTFDGQVYLNNNSNTYSVATNNGNMTFNGKIDEGNDTTGKLFSLNAGSGAITFGDTVNGRQNITANAGSFTFSNAWGGNTALGNVSLTSTNSNFTLPNLTAYGNVSLNAGTSVITTGSINTGTGNLSLISDNIDIAGDLTGTGNLLLRPYSNINMRINWFSGDYDLDTAELAHIKNGWNSLTFGHTGLGSIIIGDATWSDNVTFLKNSGGFGNIRISGLQTLNDGASATFSSAYTDFENSLTTNGGSITANGVSTFYNNSAIATSGGAVTLNGDVRINASGSGLNVTSGGGNISITGAIFDINGSTAGKTSTLTAGSGTLSFSNIVNTASNITANAAHLLFNGAWGGSTTLGTVSLTSANSYALPAIKAASLYLNTLATVTQTAALEATNLLLTGNGGTYTLTNSGNTIGTLAGNTGSIHVINGNNNLAVGTVNSVTGLTTTSGNTTLNAGTGTITTAAIAVGAHNLTLISDDIDIIGDLSGTGTLALRPYTAVNTVRINFYSGDYNLDTAEIAHLTDGWSLIDIGRVDAANSFNFGGATFTDPVKFNGYFIGIFGSFIGTGNASFTSDNGVSIYSNNTISTQGGNVTINNYLDFDQGGTITTNNGNLTVQDTVTASNTGGSVIMNTGNGTLNFNSTVDGGFDLTATAANFLFNGAWGSTSPLGNVILNSTNALTLPSITALNILAKTTSASADITIGSGSSLSASGTGTAITLASGRNFLNHSGATTPFTLSGGGRWLVYSNNPTANSLNGLTGGFEQYSCNYLGACTGLPTTGNGLLYSAAQSGGGTNAPSVTASTLPPQVLRAINIDPYIPSTRVVSIPITYKSEMASSNSKPSSSSGERDETLETSSTATRRPNTDNQGISITFSNGLQREFNVQTD